jgi:hypothetical protein
MFALGLTAIIPPVGFVLFLVILFMLCATYRLAAVLLGLTLAVACLFCAITFMTDPNLEHLPGFGLLFVPWAVLGLWLAASGLSRK